MDEQITPDNSTVQTPGQPKMRRGMHPNAVAALAAYRLKTQWKKGESGNPLGLAITQPVDWDNLNLDDIRRTLIYAFRHVYGDSRDPNSMRRLLQYAKKYPTPFLRILSQLVSRDIDGKQNSPMTQITIVTGTQEQHREPFTVTVDAQSVEANKVIDTETPPQIDDTNTQAAHLSPLIIAAAEVAAKQISEQPPSDTPPHDHAASDAGSSGDAR